MSEHKKLVRLIARAFYSGDCPPKSAAAPQPRAKAEKVRPRLFAYWNQECGGGFRGDRAWRTDAAVRVGPRGAG
jgi:hypothetical protein